MRSTNRREFLVTSLACAGVAAAGTGVAWVARRYRALTGESRPGGLRGDRFRYDLGRYRAVDPDLVLYDEGSRIGLGMKKAAALAVGPDDAVYVAGSEEVTVHEPSGERRTSFPLPAPAHALTVDAKEGVYVAFQDRLGIFDARGRLMVESERLDGKAWLTSVSVAGDRILLADGGNRRLLWCDTTGRVADVIGDREPGFIVPSAFFEAVVDADGMVQVANPGRHRVEAYTPAGEFVDAWGGASMAAEGFCGCCNPANFTLLADGRFVTSEKGLNRIKIYSRRGEFEGFVAGPDQLIEDEALAERACRDCTVGFGMPVAADSRGRVLALDPMSGSVRMFTRAGSVIAS